MSSTEFCIKWTNYQSNIVNSVGKLKNDDEFVDVTLVCDDQSITAHKVILSACSDYFKHIFKATPCSQHTVLLPNIQCEDMMSLVQYMYTGQVYIHQDMLGRLLKTAQQLQVKGLIEQAGGCVGFKEDELQINDNSQQSTAPAATISSSSPLLLSPFQQLTPPPSVSPSSSSSSLPSPGKTNFHPIKIPSPPTPSFTWNKSNLAMLTQNNMKGSLGGVPLPFPINPLPDISEGNRLSSGKTAHANNDIMESSQDNNEDDMNNNDDLSEDELVIEEPEINSKESLKGVILKENVSPSSSQDVISASDLTGSLNFDKARSSGIGVSGVSGADQTMRMVTDAGGQSLVTHPRQRWRCMQPRLCNYCWKTFSNSFNLKQHIVNVHIQSQGVNCNICDKVVKNKWYLRKHLVTAHGAPLKRSKNSDATANVPTQD